jgi:hypothetical protein
VHTIACFLMAAALCAGGEKPAAPPSEREQKLQQAFGANSEELGRPIKLFKRDEGLVLAAGSFTIEGDGRIRLTPCSIAQFTTKSDSKRHVLTTRSKWVLLTLDRPIQLPTELGTRKILAAEFPGGLTVKFQEVAVPAPLSRRIGDDIYEELLRSTWFEFDDGKTTLYIKDARQRVLSLPAILRRDADGKIESFTWAPEAKFTVDEKGEKIHLEMRDVRSVSENAEAFFEHRVIAFPFPKAKSPQPTGTGK